MPEMSCTTECSSWDVGEEPGISPQRQPSLYVCRESKGIIVKFCSRHSLTGACSVSV